MANLIRSAKSGNDWTQYELQAYNIQVVEQSFVEFFHQNQLPPVPPIVHYFCETTDRILAPDDDTHRLLHYLDLALAKSPKICQGAAIDNFTARLLEMLGYTSGHRVILTHYALSLTICRMQCSARTDICICGENDYLFLAQRNKGLGTMGDPEPQLIAKAIAAYQQNNFMHSSAFHISTLSEITLPGITLVGTSPTFYKIKVTTELNDAVMGGTFPTNPIIVYRHTPQLPHPSSEGMKSLENRATIVQYYEVFKAFV